ncbi:MAG TPA: hypothetical protein VKU44_06875 [Terriglobia bacterium]|nr:hypothetical protein [Terriglobia bacterium]
MARLTAAQRDKLSNDDFALPGREYPIHDKDHAEMALTDVSKNGSADEKRKVRAAVKFRYPDMDVSGLKK